MNYDITTLILISLTTIGIIFIIAMLFSLHSKTKVLTHAVTMQQSAIIKLQQALKNRQATNAITENAEIIYQGLVQSINPIIKELEISPRSTNEHILWRTLGGIIDEYGKNPFVLEKLRRGIKLNPDIARNANLFLNHAEKLLSRLSETDSEGLLTATFSDGLLGQTITLFSQAKQLAQSN